MDQCARVKVKPERNASHDSTGGRIDDGPLRADHRRLFMLCCAARASDVLIPPLLLNDRRDAHQESRLCAGTDGNLRRIGIPTYLWADSIGKNSAVLEYTCS